MIHRVCYECHCKFFSNYSNNYMDRKNPIDMIGCALITKRHSKVQQDSFQWYLSGVCAFVNRIFIEYKAYQYSKHMNNMLLRPHTRNTSDPDPFLIGQHFWRETKLWNIALKVWRSFDRLDKIQYQTKSLQSLLMYSEFYAI